MTVLARACTRGEDADVDFAAASAKATSWTTLNTVQRIDCHEAWGRLPADVQTAIGSLAIQQALLSLAANSFEGGIVYLDGEHRDAADNLGQEAGNAQDRMLWDALPDLFGIWPCPEHPDGTDPFWATPMQPADEVVIDIMVEDDRLPNPKLREAL